VDVFYHPDRLLTPLKRRPDGSFSSIGLDQALDEIAARLSQISAASGPAAIGAWKGEGVGFHQQEAYVRRFIHAFGSPNYFSNDSACYNGRALGYRLVTGFYNPFPDFSHADLILLFGTNPPMCHPPFMREFADARQRGAKLVVIDPRLNPVACYANIFAQPYPGTDGALGWGLIRHLINSRQFDAGLVEQNSVGFEKIAAYAQQFTPDHVEAQSGIYANVVEQIGQLIIKSKPHISIFVGSGLEHQESGVNTVRTLAMLSCLAGGLGLSCGLFWPEPMGIRSLIPEDPLPPGTPVPIGADRYPVLHQMTGECHTMTAMDAMLGKGPYPLRALLLTAANPAVTNPNTQKVIRALRQLELFVVRDFFLTPTARLAHYVLPAATFLERSELHFFAKRQMVNLSRRIMRIEHVDDEYQFWHKLAWRLGFGERYFPWKDEDEVNRWLLEPTGLTVEKLLANPCGHVYRPVALRRDLRGILPTASGKVEFSSAYLKGLGLPEIPVYQPPRHIAAKNPEYPLVMTTGARKSLFYHSRHQNIARFRTIHPEAELEIHPDDAAALGIFDGERVKVVSAVGALVIRAKVVHPCELRQGVVEAYHGWEDWPVNRLTPDDINDPISGFPLLKAVPVRVEKA
jgi:anaerobic selenocysteine-containing dehydrogenase